MHYIFQKKYYFSIFICLLLLIIFTNSQKIENIFKGNGAKCKSKLENYRQKFSLVKSYVLTDSNIKEYITSNNITLIYIHSACNKESHEFIPTIKFVSDYCNNQNKTNIIATLDITDDENNINNQYNFRSLYYPIIILKVKGIKGGYSMRCSRPRSAAYPKALLRSTRITYCTRLH